jgi:hypothetical protein
VFYSLGNKLVNLTETKTGVTLFAIGSGIIAGGLEFVIRYELKSFAIPYWASLAIGSVVLGTTVAVIAWIEAGAVRERRILLRREIERVTALNHNVRNALQAIQYGCRMPPSQEQVKIIDESVERIDTTLKSLFPVIGDPGSERKN